MAAAHEDFAPFNACTPQGARGDVSHAAAGRQSGQPQGFARSLIETRCREPAKMLRPQVFAITAVVFLATLTEFVGVLGAVHGNGRNYEGPMGKSDRALLFGALGALVAVFGTLPAWTWHIQPMACVLLAWTVVNRVRSGLAEG